MNYIYDISLNFTRNKLYEFYEWKEEDNPELILKIPVFKIDVDSFTNIKYDDINVSKDFINSIENKTELYSPNCIGIIRYACVFSCDKGVVAVEFDSDGNSYMKSNISIEEENEIIEISDSFKYTLLDYKVKNKNKKNIIFKTRKELETEKYLLKKIDIMMENKEFLKLKYIFYEIYDEKNDDTNTIYNKLINVIKNSNYKFDKLYEIINLLDNKKIMSNNS